MCNWTWRFATVIALASCFTLGQAARAATEDLGGGFRHHGVATPVSNHRGMVATQDGEGRDVMLVWLFDHRGGYALLLIDAETGKSEEFPAPFPPGGDCPYSSILSSRNRYYTHFNSHFCEFDPVERAFTFFQKTTPQMAMSMTEDDAGRIWSATYPNSGLVSFDPATRDFQDYGSLYSQNWAQYPRSVVADDAGWIYFGVGSTAGQIIIFDPQTKTPKPLLADAERTHGYGTVYRDMSGKVYASKGSEPDVWYECHGGEATRLEQPPAVNHKPIITSHQGLVHPLFPSGKRLKVCDTVERRMVVEDPKTGETKEFTFEYTSEGAHIMGLATAPDGTICGGTAFPMRFFSYNPKTDEWANRDSYGQWNTVARQGDRFFVGGYGAGFLLEWDPAGAWVATVKDKADCNPQFLTQCEPSINRPHDLLPHPDGKTLVLAGTPGYGYTGGGLLFWDRETGEGQLIEHTDILPEHSTMSLAALPEGKLLGGSTTGAGTGGEKKAEQAELYIMDLASKRVEWHEAVFPGAQSYTDLCPGPDSLAFGFADYRRFFVFDAAERKVIYDEDTGAGFGSTNSQQGPRTFVRTPAGAIYILFVKGIAQLDPETFKITMVAESPVSIGPGGDYLDGRLYFASGSHIYSFELP